MTASETANGLSPRLRPRKQPRQRRSAETRARILDAAATVFGRDGYSHGTTNRIAEEACLSVGSLYQYFPNKDAILVELVDAHITEGTEAVTASLTRALADHDGPGPLPLADLLAAPVRAMVGLHRHDRQLHRVLFEESPRPPEQLARLHRLEDALTRFVAGLLAVHPKVTVPDVDLAARFVVVTIESLVHRVATDPAGSVDDDALTAEIVRLVTAYLTS